MFFLIFKTVLFFFFLVNSVSAAPTCGTIVPGRNKFQWGLAINSIQKYRMKGAVNKIDFKSNQAFLTLAYGILNKLVLDGKLGIGSIKNDYVNNNDFDYDTGWGGGYGLRFKLYENENQKTKIILGAHHISIHPPDEELNSVEYKTILDDNQFDALFSKDYDFGTPYVGLKLSRSRLLRRDNNGNSSFHSPWKIGVVFGYDREVSQNTFLNLEMRFIDEISFSLGLSRLF
ncbi:MAG: hypothetical protein NC818_00830 [Candidatus Omnitrophica bacterium]|nr:hypothetical protein [Candidatus Omnitrophota bacterium]